MLSYPNIDPVLFEIGPLAIRWYSLSYVLGIVLGCLYADWLNKKAPQQPQLKFFDDFLVWLVLGIILGGRLGYALFYQPDYFLSNPAEILQVWQGGMSFHGGFLGVAVASWLFCRQKSIKLLAMTDLVACAAPIGLFFGRIANFINGELYGRVTDAPIGMVFPHAGSLPRHPSQLYEAALEGLVLFILMLVLAHKTPIRYAYGALTGVFLMGYGLARAFVEFFREPDEQLGILFDAITMGQLLSLPMVVAGGVLIVSAYQKRSKDHVKYSN